PDFKVHLFIAPPTRSRMDQLLRQCTEAGVWAVHPVICTYSVAVPGKISARWQALLQEACKQSGNVFLPELHEPVNLDSALAAIGNAGMACFYGAPAPETSVPLPAVTAETAWLVGPEGGFSAAEKERIAATGALPLNLGRYIMRVETAAVCGVAVLNRVYGANE
ncbi:MAG: RsmE family RNA methyltransferase, partial [Victivallales bacterium]|nr:RsmE family RNA methyltransferase [Victivallales bacterium]